jgi:hypothetical protein
MIEHRGPRLLWLAARDHPFPSAGTIKSYALARSSLRGIIERHMSTWTIPLVRRGVVFDVLGARLIAFSSFACRESPPTSCEPYDRIELASGAVGMLCHVCAVDELASVPESA